MNKIDLLVLHGPPAAGKSSIASAMVGQLRKQGIKHAVIELDDLAKIYPLSLLSIMYKNLAAIWPNYVALGDIKIIIPTYLQRGELEIVREAAPANCVTVCEVTAPPIELRRRITDREPDEARRKRLIKYLDNYASNSTEQKFIDFKIANHDKDIKDVAAEIINKLSWLA